MTQVYWEANPADEGLAPSDLTIVQPWEPFSSITVETEATAAESHSLRFNQAGGLGNRFLAIFDTIDGVALPEAKDQEVWMKFVPSGAANNAGAPVRCDRNSSEGGATGYARMGLERNEGHATISRYVAGVYTELAADASLEQGFAVYGQRVRIEDDTLGARIRLKVWLWDDQAPDGGEPALWDLDIVDEDPIDAAGAVGYFQYEGTNQFQVRVVKWGYGSDGDVAPTEPVASGVTASGALSEAGTASVSGSLSAADPAAGEEASGALSEAGTASVSGGFLVGFAPTPGGAAFVEDSFTDTGGTLVQNHSPETGGAWSKVSATNDAHISGNHVEGTDWFADDPNSAVYLNAATPPSADYAVQASILHGTAGGGDQTGVILRSDGTATGGYRAVITGPAGGPYDFEVFAGTNPIYSETLVDITVDLRLEGEGDVIRAFINGVGRLSTLDNAYSAAGQAGFSVGLDAAHAQVDDFVAESLSNEVEASGSLSEAGTASLSASLGVADPPEVSGALSEPGTPSLTSTLALADPPEAFGMLAADATAAISGAIALEGEAQASGELQEAGTASFGASLALADPPQAAGALEAESTASVSGAFTVIESDINAIGALAAESASAFEAALALADPPEVSGALVTSGVPEITAALSVTEPVEIGGALVVAEIAQVTAVVTLVEPLDPDAVKLLMQRDVLWQPEVEETVIWAPSVELEAKW